MYTSQQMNYAVLVEAARKLKIENNGDRRHARIYQQELDRVQSELYPDIEPSILDVITGLFKTRLDEVRLDTLPEVYHLFLSNFINQYPQLVTRPESPPNSPEISQDRVGELQQELHTRFKPAIEVVRQEVGGEITQKDMATVMNIFMCEIGLPMAENQDDYQGWLCEPDESFAGYRTNPAKRRMYAGRFSAPSWSRFEELAIHEAVVHALRSENGAKIGAEAFRVGLPGNVMFEEGLGILFEQLWRGKIKIELARDDFRYITVAYADGHIDGEKHNETETMHFISSMMTAVEITNGASLDVNKLLDNARRLSYDHVRRAFRGMPPGTVLRSNLSYKHGKIEALKFVSAHPGISPADLIDYLLDGKFSPVNKKHVDIRRALDLQPNFT